jgi:predicted anti-sigma-YlaC factor YlaD
MRNRIPADECARASERVSLHLDGQLSEFEELLLDAHIERCPDCKAYAANVAGLTRALRSTPLEQPSVTFAPPRRTRRPVTALLTASAAAAVAVVGLNALVGLHVFASQVRPGTIVNPKVINLKERQMDQLSGLVERANTKVRPNLAEQVTVGTEAATIVVRPASPTGFSPR